MTIFDMAIFAMAGFDMASFDSAMFDVPSLDMGDFARAILKEGEFWNGEFWQDEFWHGEFRQLFAIKIVNSRQATIKSRQWNANSAISNFKSCQIYNLGNNTMKMSNRNKFVESQYMKCQNWPYEIQDPNSTMFNLAV